VSRKFVSIHDTTFPAFQAGNQATSSVMNFWFRTLDRIRLWCSTGSGGGKSLLAPAAAASASGSVRRPPFASPLQVPRAPLHVR
jgi:hypothetical protein